MTRIAYILASSHSGSTLLSMLLGSHPQIATIGEMKLSPRAIGDLNRYRCSCGKMILECGFWREVRENMVNRGFAFDLACAGTDYRTLGSHYVRRILAASHKGRFLECVRDAALGLSLTWRSQLLQVHKQNVALAETIAQVTDAEVIVDSSKCAVRLKYLLRNPDLDVKVIHLIRDGRAVALTSMDTPTYADASDPALRGGGTGWRQQEDRPSMAEAAYRWRRCMESTEHVLKRVNRSCWIKVHYEDYCRDSDGTLSRLCVFLGLDPDKRANDFRSVQHHVVGNGMRLDSTSEIQLDERWRQVLTAKQMQTFEAVAGKLNRRYGYV